MTFDDWWKQARAKGIVPPWDSNKASAKAAWDFAIQECANEIERKSGETYAVVLCEHKEAADWLRSNAELTRAPTGSEQECDASGRRVE